jgi:hypothetical protein
VSINGRARARLSRCFSRCWFAEESIPHWSARVKTLPVANTVSTKPCSLSIHPWDVDRQSKSKTNWWKSNLTNLSCERVLIWWRWSSVHAATKRRSALSKRQRILSLQFQVNYDLQRLFPVSPKNIIPPFVPSEEADVQSTRYGIYRFSSHAAETPRSQQCFDSGGY